MCRSRKLVLPLRLDHGVARQATRIALTGLAASGVAMFLFMVIHALLIAPVWTQVGNGLPLALIGGIGLAAAFEQAARLRTWRSLGDGARFGGLMFLTVIPATLFSNALRLAGVHANDWQGVVGSLAIALASGAAMGWFVTGRREGTAVFAAATIALTMAMAGPIPIANSLRAFWLFAGFVPILIGAGVALAFARAHLVDEDPS